MLKQPQTTAKASTLPFWTQDYCPTTSVSSHQAWLTSRKNGAKASPTTYFTLGQVETGQKMASSHTGHSEMTAASSHTTTQTQTSTASAGDPVTELTSQAS